MTLLHGSRGSAEGGTRVSIHPTAIVDRHAELGSSVEIGPYCVVGAGVRLGDRTKLLSHAVVTGRTTLGEENVVHPFAVLGGEGQIKKSGETQRPTLEIGDRNVFREHVTVNLSSHARATVIGSDNLFMAGCHVAHDVVLGSHVVVANAVQLAGHSIVDDWVIFGGLSGVAQRVRVGESAFVAAGAMCERDVPPFVIVQGDRARARAINVVGLERRGVPPESISALKKAFARTFLNRESKRPIDYTDPYVQQWVSFLGRQ